MGQPKKPPTSEAFEDHVLSRMLSMPPEPHAAPKVKAKKKPAKKPPKK